MKQYVLLVTLVLYAPSGLFALRPMPKKSSSVAANKSAASVQLPSVPSVQSLSESVPKVEEQPVVPTVVPIKSEQQDVNVDGSAEESVGNPQELFVDSKDAAAALSIGAFGSTPSSPTNRQITLSGAKIVEAYYQTKVAYDKAKKDDPLVAVTDSQKKLRDLYNRAKIAFKDAQNNFETWIKNPSDMKMAQQMMDTITITLNTEIQQAKAAIDAAEKAQGFFSAFKSDDQKTKDAKKQLPISKANLRVANTIIQRLINKK